MTRFEILIELNNLRYNLDLFQEESIEVNYNIADINDISSRNSSYTKTIRIPETSLNRQIFGDIADLSVSSTFNPNLKTKCWVLVDTVVVLEGYLQLRNVTDDIDLGGRVYEVVIFAENDNFVKELQDLELTDLDFSELSHTYSSTNIITSWTQSWNWGYYYPVIDYGYDWDYSDISGSKFGANKVEIEDMYPATNVKYILDKIFRDANYSYQSEFLNSNVFKDLYIPFNRDYLKKDISGFDGKFAVALSTPQTYTASFVPFVSSINLDVPTILGFYRIPFDDESIPYGDPSGVYDNVNFEYVATTFPISNFICDFDITFNYLGDTDFEYFFGASTNPYTAYIPANGISFRRSKDPATGVDVPNGTVIPVNGSTIPVPFNTDSIPSLEIIGPSASTGSTPIRVKGQLVSDLLDDSTVERTRLYPGEKVWVEVIYGCSGRELLGLNVGDDIITLNLGNVFYNNLIDRIAKDEFIDYTFTVIPKNIKQIDFFTSLIKMFNLYVEPSKEYDRTLLIEPREQFYESGDIVDWTKKLDINTPLDIKILGETQNKKTIFTYKEDKDYYNVDYKDFKAGEIYGQFDYEIDNDFVTGERKVQLVFSPTPIVKVPSSTKLVIPKIGKIQNNLFSPTDHNIRILTKFRSSTTGEKEFTNVTQYTSTDVWNEYTQVTFASAHGLSEGDCISFPFPIVNKTNPIFKVITIIDATNIVINLLFSEFTGSTTGFANVLEGLLPTDDGLELWAFGDGTFGDFRYRAYPYLGHFNNPFEPNYDINFGQTIGLYYPENSVTNDNLFSVYWQNQMTELSDKDSRIITGDFYLTPDDIASFRFNQKVFLINQYYKVNKITYNPVENGLSRVELIKSLVVTVPREFSLTNPSVPNSATFSNDSEPPIKEPVPTGVVIGGPRNVVKKNKNIVVGTDNASYGQNVYLFGDNNTVTSNENFIVGDNNKTEVSSNENFIIGDNNTILSNTSNVFVIGDGLSLDESNTVYIQDILVQAPNYISGCRNEAMNPFSATEVNYISASRDVVRELGTMKNINYVSAGIIIII